MSIALDQDQAAKLRRMIDDGFTEPDLFAREIIPVLYESMPALAIDQITETLSIFTGTGEIRMAKKATTKKAATRSRRSEASTETAVLDLPVEFGGVSIGQTTARLGVRINREQLNLIAADECFCGHRLQCTLVLGRNDDAEGQQTLVDDLNEEISGTADVKRLGIAPGTISTGLTFSLPDIDIATLAKFSKGSGRLIVESVSAIPNDAADSDGEDDDSDDETEE